MPTAEDQPQSNGAVAPGPFDLAFYPFFIGGRYLRRKRISYLAIAGVCLSVMTLSVVMSVMKGFDAKLRQRVRGQLSDLTLEPAEPRLYAFKDWRDVAERVRGMEQVEAVAPYLEGLALVKVGKQFLYARFRAIDPETEPAVSEINEHLANFFRKYREDRLEQLMEKETELNAQALERQVDEEVRRLEARLATDTGALARRYPDQNQAQIPGAFVGGELYRYTYDSIILVTATEDLRRRIRKFRIAGVFKSGMYDYDSQVILIPLDVGMQFVDSRGAISGLSIRLKNPKQARFFKHELTKRLAVELRRSSFVDPGGLIARLRTQADPASARIWTLLDKPLKEALEDCDVEEPISDELLTRLADGLTALLERRELFTEEILEETGRATFYRRMLGEDLGGPALMQVNRMILGDMYMLYISRMPQYRALTWEDKRRTILNAVKMERIVMAFILAFIMVVAGFCIFAILTMTVFEKRRDIGILKAVGMTKRGIASVFLFDGFAIGLIGVSLGLGFSLLIIHYINAIESFIERQTGWTPFPRDIYYFDQIPTDKGLRIPLIVCGAALLLSLLFSVIPAWRAARQDPIETLRFE